MGRAYQSSRVFLLLRVIDRMIFPRDGSFVRLLARVTARVYQYLRVS